MAVCEELHFTKAADKAGISQPNLSLQIKALEEEIGMPLFDRIGKRIALTDAGGVLLKHARGMFQNLQNAKLEIGELRHHQGGTLGVGVLPSELDFRLTPMFIDFRNRIRMSGSKSSRPSMWRISSSVRKSTSASRSSRFTTNPTSCYAACPGRSTA